MTNQHGWVLMLRTQRVSRSGVSVLVLLAWWLIGPSVSMSKADGLDADLELLLFVVSGALRHPGSDS